MRPERLRISAFGPYAGQEDLDFSALGNHTLFLICGPTGAGKSTILDAMARLRQKYPRMMTIQSHRRMNSGSGERSFDLMKKVDPLDMFRVFYKEFQDKEFTEEEENYMKELWEDLRKEDD